MENELKAAIELLRHAKENLSGKVDTMNVLVAQTLVDKAQSILDNLLTKLL